ncbi:MAG: hypothetical protein L0Y73_06105 [Candidatus Aminicenantes bacterium]|nr:hypothetical protein [Candidatus Aminicenantes bacterium]
MNVNLNIEKEDIDFLKKLLHGKTSPMELDEVAYQLALFKTREKRTNKVKIYNPNCDYKVGDLIYKEYPGKIPIGSKRFIEMDQGVVLRVTEARERFGSYELKLSYEGTSDFRLYIDYLERQKIELLLPFKQAKPCEEIEYLSKDIDPRQEQAPLVERDFNILKRKIISAANRETDMCLISNRVLLLENLEPIEPSVFDRIKEFLKEHKESVTAEFLVENFVKIEPRQNNFAANCFSLNYIMKNDYKIDFQQTNDSGWGKWNLISVIYYMKKSSIMNEENPLLNKVTLGDKKNISLKRRKFEEAMSPEKITKYYLTQREITAGAVITRPGFFEAGESIEIEIIDGRSKKAHLIYYYSDANLMLGFKEIFEKYKVLQGTLLTFEQGPDKKVYFNVRTIKKDTIADKIEYDPGKKAFRALEEKIVSPVLIAKSMFLESGVFNTIYERIDEFRQVETLNKLIHKVFLEFGLKEKNYEIHILRLYHILDLVYPIDLRLVEEVLLSNFEFIPSEKVVGVFYLDSAAVSEIEEAEYKRRKMVVGESKKKENEVKKMKRDEELRIKEEIRRKREERRRKREHEMFLKEKMEKERKEREELRLLELKKKKEAQKRAVAAKTPAHVTPTGEVDHKKPFQGPKRDFKRPPREEREALPVREQAIAPPVKEIPPIEPPLKPVHPKKVKKIKEEEETPRTPKKVQKKPIEEKMTEDEIKSQIELEELKDKIAARQAAAERAKKAEEEKKVAYSDDGSFAGIFASKLDKIVKKDDDKGENGKKSSKK